MTGTVDVRLSHAQQRFLWDEEMAPGQDDNNVVLAYLLTGPVDPAALTAAFDDVVRRHDVLRSVYLWDVAPEPVQRVMAAETAAIALERVTVADPALPPAEIAARVCADWWDSPFALERRPPVRARLAGLSADSWLLCLNLHHIAFDGQSELLLAADLGAAYEARVLGRAPVWEDVPGYGEYARWEADRIPVWAEKDRPFWRHVLADPAPALLATPEADQGVRGEFEIALSARATDRIRDAVRARRAIVMSALLHETSAAVGDVFGVDAVNLATVSSGRFEKAHASILGCFVNPLVLPLSGIRTADSRRAPDRGEPSGAPGTAPGPPSLRPDRARPGHPGGRLGTVRRDGGPPSPGARWLVRCRRHIPSPARPGAPGRLRPGRGARTEPRGPLGGGRPLAGGPHRRTDRSQGRGVPGGTPADSARAGRRTMTDPTDRTQVVAVDGDTILLQDGEQGPELADMPPPSPAVGHVTGTDAQGRPYLAVPRDDVPPGTRRARLIDVLDELPPAQVGTALRAVGFHQWVRASHHCPRCGTPADLRPDGRSRWCANCATEHHPRIDPAVMMSVTDDQDRLLLARRAVAPPGRMSPRPDSSSRGDRRGGRGSGTAGGGRGAHDGHHLHRQPALALPRKPDARLRHARLLAAHHRRRHGDRHRPVVHPRPAKDRDTHRSPRPAPTGLARGDAGEALVRPRVRHAHTGAGRTPDPCRAL
ncbi:condensation domain-containing protein [Streptomyces albus]|nr:condensation domain-containing protein [Streptomyces albus]